jgi:putative aldouronate transport system permease protein
MKTIKERNKSEPTAGGRYQVQAVSGARFRKVFLANYQLYILMLPAIAATFIFAYIPIYGLQIAFKNFSTSAGIWDSKWVGLEHFRRFISYPLFWQMIRNTLSISLYQLATFPLTIILALLINEIQSLKFKKVVQMVSYAPHFLSTVVLCGIVTLFLGRANGIINNFIELLGGVRIDFMAKPSMFSSIYVWSGVWQTIGWGTIIYLAALTSISQELIEAAKIDGARRLDIIRHVNIPSIMPTVIVLFILSTGSVLSVGFEKIFLLSNVLNQEASRVISVYVYNVGLLSGQFSYASAIGLFNTVINLIVLIIVNHISRRISEVALW